MTEEDIIIESGIDNFGVDENSLAPEFDGDILEEPFKR
jgi:hypothetical protein